MFFPAPALRRRSARILHIGLTQHRNNQEMVGLRSDRGADIVTKLGMGEFAAEAVRSLDEHWDGSGYPDSMKGEQIPLLARICAVAQHLDIFSAGRGTQNAIDTLEERSGTWFDPQLVRIALSLHRRGTLWANCSSRRSRGGYAAGSPRPRCRHTDISSSRARSIRSARPLPMSSMPSLTSPSVTPWASRTRRSASPRRWACRADRVQLVRRAALLHDIGKLSVSNTILDKSTHLSASEWKAVHQHPRIYAPDSGTRPLLPGDGRHRGRAPRKAGRLRLS